MPRIQPIGVDLGTTYSAVACLDQAGHTKMVTNIAGEILTPSVVLFEDDQTIVGKAARKAGVLQADRLAECVKRDMGSAAYSRPIHGKFLPPEAIQACILRQLKQDITRAVGPATAVVVTVPAFFDEPRRKATSDAGEMAGLTFLDIVNEPTAAALAFGEELGYLTPTGDARQPLTLLVYDLGGGTFDVTVIRLQPGDVRTLATDGDVYLGGRDWDVRLANFAADAFVQKFRADPREEPASWQRLLNEVEETKRTLTARQQAHIAVDHAGNSMTVPVTREIFEDLTADLLERTAHTTRQVLKDADVAWPDVDRVLLVGGSSRMPMVSQMIERMSGKTPARSVNPDEAVARGAAIYAGYLLAKRDPASQPASFEVTDVNAHSLGIEGVDPSTGSRRNAILIPRNTPLPVSKTREFVTRMANQSSIAMRILEGESTQPDECTPIGQTLIDNLPSPLPQGWPIKVTYHYGANGRLHVLGVVPGTDREVSLEIERDRGMTEERISQWKTAIAKESGLDPFESLIATELSQVLSLENVEPSATTRHSATLIAPGNGAEISDDEIEILEVDDALGETASGESTAFESPPDWGAAKTRRRRASGTLVNLAGHLIFSVLGLVLGYYLLCWIAPDANFLHLRLPGLHH